MAEDPEHEWGWAPIQQKSCIHSDSILIVCLCRLSKGTSKCSPILLAPEERGMRDLEFGCKSRNELGEAVGDVYIYILFIYYFLFFLISAEIP